VSGGHVLDVGPGHVQRPPDPRHLQVVTVRVQFNKFGVVEAVDLLNVELMPDLEEEILQL